MGKVHSDDIDASFAKLAKFLDSVDLGTCNSVSGSDTRQREIVIPMVAIMEVCAHVSDDPAD